MVTRPWYLSSASMINDDIDGMATGGLSQAVQDDLERCRRADKLKGTVVIEWRQADEIRATAQGRVPAYVSTAFEVHWDAGARNRQCPRFCGCGIVDEETGLMRPLQRTVCCGVAGPCG